MVTDAFDHEFHGPEMHLGTTGFKFLFDWGQQVAKSRACVDHATILGGGRSVRGLVEGSFVIDASGLKPDAKTLCCPGCRRRVTQLLVTVAGRIFCTACVVSQEGRPREPDVVAGSPVR